MQIFRQFFQCLGSQKTLIISYFYGRKRPYRTCPVLMNTVVFSQTKIFSPDIFSKMSCLYSMTPSAAYVRSSAGVSSRHLSRLYTRKDRLTGLFRKPTCSRVDSNYVSASSWLPFTTRLKVVYKAFSRHRIKVDLKGEETGLPISATHTSWQENRVNVEQQLCSA